MADAPRFAYPLRIKPGGVTVVEQDSLDDLVSTAFYASRTTPGSRSEAPGFGVNDPTFSLNPAPQLVADLERSDPRLVLVATQTYDDILRQMQVRLSITGAAT